MKTASGMDEVFLFAAFTADKQPLGGIFPNSESEKTWGCVFFSCSYSHILFGRRHTSAERSVWDPPQTDFLLNYHDGVIIVISAAYLCNQKNTSLHDEQILSVGGEVLETEEEFVLCDLTTGKFQCSSQKPQKNELNEDGFSGVLLSSCVIFLRMEGRYKEN